MAGSVVRSSTTSAISAEKPRASKKSARSNRTTTARAAALEKQLNKLFGELARIAELSTIERKLRERGFRFIAGTDEVGRGAFAGPVVAAAVILHEDAGIVGVNDSKQLHAENRATVCQHILAHARAVGIGVVEPHIIDSINILQASKLAMKQAVENLLPRPEVLLLDAVVVENLDMPQLALIEGDRRSVSIAAASIVAKVYRDQLMESYHGLYPDFDFVHNRGYGTEQHQDALRRLGPTPIHRRSFLVMNERTLFDVKREDGSPAR